MSPPSSLVLQDCPTALPPFPASNYLGQIRSLHRSLTRETETKRIENRKKPDERFEERLSSTTTFDVGPSVGHEESISESTCLRPRAPFSVLGTKKGKKRITTPHVTIQRRKRDGWNFTSLDETMRKIARRVRARPASWLNGRWMERA